MIWNRREKKWKQCL